MHHAQFKKPSSSLHCDHASNNIHTHRSRPAPSKRYWVEVPLVHAQYVLPILIAMSIRMLSVPVSICFVQKGCSQLEMQLQSDIEIQQCIISKNHVTTFSILRRLKFMPENPTNLEDNMCMFRAELQYMKQHIDCSGKLGVLSKTFCCRKPTVELTSLLG